MTAKVAKKKSAPTKKAAPAKEAAGPKPHRIYSMSFASVYPHYITKAEKKGRTQAEVDEIVRWLTGYTQAKLDALGLDRLGTGKRAKPLCCRAGPFTIADRHNAASCKDWQ